MEFRENYMHSQYLVWKIPVEIPREFSSPTPHPGSSSGAESVMVAMIDLGASEGTDV